MFLKSFVWCIFRLVFFFALSGVVWDFIFLRALFGAFQGLSFVPCGFLCDFIFLMSFVWSIFGLMF
jgi:hypothetical protein